MASNLHSCIGAPYGIGEHGALVLAQYLAYNSSVVRMNLSGNAIGSRGYMHFLFLFRIFCRMVSFPEHRSASLVDTHTLFALSAMAVLRALQWNQTITSIVLSKNGIEPITSRTIAEVDCFPSCFFRLLWAPNLTIYNLFLSSMLG
jgi:hypothetical protein